MNILWIILFPAIILFISFLFSFVIYRKQFGIRIESIENNLFLNDCIGIKETFLSRGDKLTGYFYGDKQKLQYRNEIILLVHGYGMTHKDYGIEIKEFVSRNHLVFAYDMTGCGDSEGKEMYGFSRFIIDAQAAVEYLNGCGYADKIVLFGHSTGGFAVAALLNSKNINIKSAIIMSGFNSPASYVKMCMQKTLKGFAYFMQFWTYVFERIRFGEVGSYTGGRGIDSFMKSVLIIQSKDDDIVPYESSLYSRKSQIKNKNAVFAFIEQAKHYPTRENVNGKKSANSKVFHLMEDFLIKGADLPGQEVS